MEIKRADPAVKSTLQGVRRGNRRAAPRLAMERSFGSEIVRSAGILSA